jgi:hypothetical protein
LNKDGLIGMFGHTYDDEGLLHYQFRILRRTDDHYVCQLFSFMDGYPTDWIAMSRQEILGY